MQKRRRFKQETSFQVRLTTFANEMRKRAATIKSGPERENFLRRAHQADTARHLDDWANSPVLQPPK